MSWWANQCSINNLYAGGKPLFTFLVLLKGCFRKKGKFYFTSDATKIKELGWKTFPALSLLVLWHVSQDREKMKFEHSGCGGNI